MLDLLSGLRVVSFNHFLLGPMGIQALADLGADVIAVESTDGALGSGTGPAATSGPMATVPLFSPPTATSGASPST